MLVIVAVAVAAVGIPVALLVLLLAEQGRLGLDDTVARWLPGRRRHRPVPGRAHAGQAARPGRGRRDADRRLLVGRGYAQPRWQRLRAQRRREGYKTNVWVSSDGSRVVVLLLKGRMADQATGDRRAAQALDWLYRSA